MKITRRSFLTFSTLALMGIATAPDDAAGIIMGTAPKSSTPSGEPGSFIVEDVHGNNVNQKGLALVDWDGYIANPAVKFFVRPGPGMVLPATVILTASEPRLYFDLPSDVGAQGPTKKIELNSPDAKVPVFLSIFPDRQTHDADFPLHFWSIDMEGNKNTSAINVHVFDQDTNASEPFVVLCDFSQDRTGFFQDMRPCNVVRQAAADWAYFVDDMHFDMVQAGADQTWISGTDRTGGSFVSNDYSYTGYLLYAYGVHSDLQKSGGYAQEGEPQSSSGVQLPLMRSGGILMETNGNYNGLGYSLSMADSDWWRATNLAEESNEFFSITHHEIGHALFFMQSYPAIKQAVSSGVLNSEDLTFYHGRGLNIDKDCHFTGEFDGDSGRAAFGSEYHGFMPHGRWIITKLDILAAEAVGYKVRKTFDLAILTTALPGGEPGVPYQAPLKARGGIPWYQWSVESGKLPAGLSLDAETGVISGTPVKFGVYEFKIQLTDSSEVVKTISAELSIRIHHHQRKYVPSGE